MTRKFLNLTFTGILSCGIAFANESKVEDNLDLSLEKRISNGEFDKSLETIKKAYEVNKDNKATRASAPPVSAVYILQVCSTEAGGCEYISEGQTSTNLNHGGSTFYVVTGVVGYGGSNTDSATFAGNQAKLVDWQGAANSSGVVYGWYEQWDISKPSNTNGTFTYTARSINVGPTMNVSIYIK